MYELFEWDDDKNEFNVLKHNISFEEAAYAFEDKHRVIFVDDKNSTELETRYFCLGKVQGEIITVRFVYRNNKIRIFGAGYWRKGKKHYEKENNLH